MLVRISVAVALLGLAITTVIWPFLVRERRAGVHLRTAPLGSWADPSHYTARGLVYRRWMLRGGGLIMLGSLGLVVEIIRHF